MSVSKTQTEMMVTLNSVAAGIPVKLKVPKGKSGLCLTATSLFTWPVGKLLESTYMTQPTFASLDRITMLKALSLLWPSGGIHFRLTEEVEASEQVND